MATHEGLRFGIFLAPFHRVGDNPTLALGRDLELIQWLDTLGYDEAWIGEHHSAGWEIIAAPQIFIGVAAEKTRHIMLGSGVTSLPYHHPLLVAQRFVQFDPMRGRRCRTTSGCGCTPAGRKSYRTPATRSRHGRQQERGSIGPDQKQARCFVRGAARSPRGAASGLTSRQPGRQRGMPPVRENDKKA
jgi:hypothetical protein